MSFDWSGYFDWLVETIRGNDAEYEDMLPVLDFLFDKEFYWTNELDANRAHDGVRLRSRYANEYGGKLKEKDLEVPCNMLEMLVRLAVDVEDHITGDPDYPQPEIWFWKWLENIGIDDRCTGEGFSGEYIDQQIDRWLDGQITKKGKHSPFPLKHSGVDQRKKDIWGQCMAYIIEVEEYF